MFDFSASHTLARSDWSTEKNQQVFGKCSNPNGHGHNYRLEVIVSGKVAADTAMIIDTSKLSQIVEELVLNDLDHRNLNLDVVWLKGVLPSSENLVDAIWNRLEPAVNKISPNAQLQKLILWETRKIYAVRER